MHHFQGFRPGDIVDGRYQVNEEIGRGGFGVVYKARQMAIDRVVALKILLPEADTVDPQAVERFRREAVLISNLESPNTITLIEFGQTDQGALYTVMEYARGDTLRDILAREHKLDARRAVRIASQVLDSLNEAHQRGIIHRDLKPANIMVGEFAGQTDHVKVLDFGIAKILKSGDTQSTLALTGRIVGTPRYMAPEQLRGAAPTPACDLYAMGLIFYEMLTGGPVIRATDAMAQVEAQMKKESFRLPQLPGVPLDLVTAVNKALEKDASRRFQSAQVFKEEIEASISGRKPDADPNKTRVRGAAEGPVQFQARQVGGPPTAEYEAEGGGGLGGFLIAAVVLFMLALGGVAFLLFADQSGTSNGGAANNTADAATAPANNESPPTPLEPNDDGARRPLPTPRGTNGAGLGSGMATPPAETPPSEQTGTDPAQTPPTEQAPTPVQATPPPVELPIVAVVTPPPVEATPPPVEQPIVAVVTPPPVEATPPPVQQPVAVATVSIEVTADPDRSSVYIGDDRVCRSTPCTVQVPGDGSAVELRVSRSGYHSERRNISSSDAPNVRVELRERPEAQEDAPQQTTGTGLVPL